MAKLSSGLFILLIAALVTATIAGPAVSAGQTTSMRSMPSSAVPGASFTVTITIDVDENNAPSALTISERVPSGLTVGEANPPSFSPASGSLLWVITPSQSGGKITDQSITYTVSGTTAGAYAFNGNVYAGGNYTSTAGSITIKIKDPCTENWSCGEWSACHERTQQRECTDSNSCPLPESRPAMSQACTAAAVTNPSTEDQGSPSVNVAIDDDSGNGTAGNDTNGTADAINTTSDDAIDDEITPDQSGVPDNAGGSGPVGGSQENTASPATDDKENKTAEEKITGKAVDSAASRNASGSSFSQAFPDNAASEENNARDNSDMPLFTLALAVILAAMIAILGMKKLNLIGTS